MKHSNGGICNWQLFQKQAISIRADPNLPAARAVPFLAMHKRRRATISLARCDRVARCWAVGDLLAEQAADQFDRGARGPAAFVQERIELDDVD